MRGAFRLLLAAGLFAARGLVSFGEPGPWIEEEESSFLRAASLALERSPGVGGARARLSRAFLGVGIISETLAPDIGLSLIPMLRTDFPRSETRTAGLDFSASLKQALPSGGYFRLAASVPLRTSLLEESGFSACLPALEFELSQDFYLHDALRLSRREAELRLARVELERAGVELDIAENACVLELASQRCLLSVFEAKRSSLAARGLFLGAKREEERKAFETGYLSRSALSKVELEFSKNALELLRVDASCALAAGRIESMTGMPMNSGNLFSLPPRIGGKRGAGRSMDQVLLEIDAKEAEANVVLEDERRLFSLNVKISSSPESAAVISGGSPLESLALSFSGKEVWTSSVSLGLGFSSLALGGESSLRALELEHIEKERLAREAAHLAALRLAELEAEFALQGKELLLIEDEMMTERLALDEAEAARGWGSSSGIAVFERRASLAALAAEWTEKEGNLRFLELRILDAKGFKLINLLRGT